MMTTQFSLKTTECFKI